MNRKIVCSFILMLCFVAFFSVSEKCTFAAEIEKGILQARGGEKCDEEQSLIPQIPSWNEFFEEEEILEYLSYGEEKEPDQRELIVAEARKHLGKPYHYGASGPNSFDCSGLVNYCFQSIGVNVPRTSKDYGGIGKAVGIGEARPGDVVCFNTNGKRISHVGIYIGEGAFIHAASGSKTHKVMINHLSENYFKNRLVTIRSIL